MFLWSVFDSGIALSMEIINYWNVIAIYSVSAIFPGEYLRYKYFFGEYLNNKYEEK